MDDTLTDRQLRFVFEYLKDQNAGAAAARAGYTAKNPAAQGNELMNNPAVRERVRLELQSLLAELDCPMLQLIKERKRAAFFRAQKMFSQGWELLAPDQMEPETRAALEVSTVMRRSGPVVRLKQPDRDRALRALERVHERLERRNEAHYAKLERAGKRGSLDEIERMDAPDAADEFAKKDQVLSGSNTKWVDPAPEFFEKPQDLSGPAGVAATAAPPFAEKMQYPPGTQSHPRALTPLPLAA